VELTNKLHAAEPYLRS